MAKGKRAISAMVLLRSASGERVKRNIAITSENIQRYQPDPDEARAVRAEFAERGFEVGAVVGVSFAVTAPPDVFERTFGVTVREEDDGSIEIAGARGLALPLDALPAELARRISDVAFTPPADLHGGGSFP
jgi:hypothetical protein